MKKLCLKCVFSVSPMHPKSPIPPPVEVFQMCDSNECEQCAENNAVRMADEAKKEDDWQAAKTAFIQNMREINRPIGWKNRLISKISDQN